VPVIDHDARVRADLHDLIREAALGDIGFNVAWGFLPAQVAGQPDPLMVPAWQIEFTCRNPLIGQPDLYCAVLLKPELVGIAEGPSRDTLRRIVADSIADLQQQEQKIRADTLASANGNRGR